MSRVKEHVVHNTGRAISLCVRGMSAVNNSRHVQLNMLKEIQLNVCSIIIIIASLLLLYDTITKNSSERTKKNEIQTNKNAFGFEPVALNADDRYQNCIHKRHKINNTHEFVFEHSKTVAIQKLTISF